MVKIRSNLAEFSDSRLRRILADLPRAKEYRLTVKPLRYRTSPHLQAECDYESKTITVQVPEPFRPFRQRIPYRAKRIKSRRQRGNAFAFRRFYRNILLPTKSDLIRFLYCHEYTHYSLYEILHKKGSERGCSGRTTGRRMRCR